MQQLLCQLLRVDRLGNVRVHAGSGAVDPVLRHCRGGHGDDRQFVSLRQLADAACGFEAVHHRHVQVHQHRVERLLLHLLQRLLAVVGQTYAQAGTAQEFACHLLVEFVVFHQQDVRAAQLRQHYPRCEEIAVAARTCALRLLDVQDRIQQLGRYYRLGQHQIEPRRAGFVAQLFAVVRGDHGEDRRRFDTPLAGGVFHRQRHVQSAHAGHFPVQQQ